MSSIHLELLDEKRRKTFEGLKIFEREGTLAGGTALSLQIKHRLSFDFDVFLYREIKRKDFLKLEKAFGVKRTEINTPDQLTITTNDDVNTTLVRYYHQPLFEKVRTSSLPLYSVRDLAADKAFTVGRRAVWRDYVDLFFILKQEGLDIFKLTKLAQSKFGAEFNPKLFLEQLIFFKDLEVAQISFVKEGYSEEEIKSFLEDCAKMFKEKQITSQASLNPKSLVY